MRPAPDFFRRRQADADGIEIRNRILHFERARTKQGVPPLPALEAAASYQPPVVSFYVPQWLRALAPWNVPSKVVCSASLRLAVARASCPRCGGETPPRQPPRR